MLPTGLLNCVHVTLHKLINGIYNFGIYKPTKNVSFVLEEFQMWIKQFTPMLHKKCGLIPLLLMVSQPDRLICKIGDIQRIKKQWILLTIKFLEAHSCFLNPNL